MSADFNTLIHVSGSKEGIVKILEVIRYYEVERHEQYRAKEPYYVDYLEWVKVCEGKKIDSKKAISLEEIKDIEAYVNELKKGEITIEAMGPYGRFGTLDEIDLYNDLVEKLDDSVEFNGSSYGFDSGGRQSLDAIYKNGKLEVDVELSGFEDDEYDEEEEDDDIDYEQIIKNIKKILPLKEFKTIFKIKGKLSADDYECMIDEGMTGEENFQDAFGDKEDFEDFVNEYIESDEEYTISDEDFKAGVAKIEELGIKELMP